VAATAELGLPLVWAAFAVSVAAHVVSALLLFGLLSRALGVYAPLAATVTILWLSLAVNFDVVVDALSEPSMVLATLASVWCYWRSTTSASRLAWQVASGLCALLAFEMRYAGLFFIAGAGLVLVQWLRLPTRTGLKGLCLWGAVPAIGVAVTFARNYALVGSALGGPAAHESHSPRELALNLYWSLSRSLGWALSESSLELIGLTTALVAFGLCVALALRSGRSIAVRFAEVRSWSENPLVAISAGYVLMTLLALAWMTLTGPAPVSMRYLQPLWPFLCILLAPALRTRAEPHRAGRWLRLAAGTLLMLALVIGQLSAYRAILGDLRIPEPRTSIDHVLDSTVGDMQLRECVQQLVVAGGA
jgi:hypothetical protein